MSQPKTLHEYLTLANPIILNTRPRSAATSCTINKQWPIPQVVRPWTDFTIEKIRSIFDEELGTFLDKEMDNLPPVPDVSSTFLNVHCESALSKLITKWHQTVVLNALARTPLDLAQQQVQMTEGAEARLLFDKSNRFTPDWAGTRWQDSNLLPNILPGDTKLSWKWKSSELRTTPYKFQWPLRQLLCYCLFSRSRYGYIITDKELVAIRVHKPEDRMTKTRSPLGRQAAVSTSPVVEYTAIPWSASGTSDGLTINLALWVLHILAANNGRLQSEPYGSLDKEKIISHERPTAIPTLNEEEEMDWKPESYTEGDHDEEDRPFSGQEPSPKRQRRIGKYSQLSMPPMMSPKTRAAKRLRAIIQDDGIEDSSKLRRSSRIWGQKK